MLGEKGKPAEKVGKEAAKRLLAEIEGGGSADFHASDQLLTYLALSSGDISARTLTEHARTNIQTMEKFLGKTFTVDDGRVVRFSR